MAPFNALQIQVYRATGHCLQQVQDLVAARLTERGVSEASDAGPLQHGRQVR